ncbi:PEP-CTERM sorting domain-containing protein [Cerasicoccus maritimus]|uniref:PEP-CTERM sorting domain-containing protein n=1 Tax=Cerasicoccus maritimus TaxID=490089 RepID=UPI0028528C30|nr:PEP-CTERM sorting domain-containing protein [Cerasicoccus maritimus]
MCYSKLKLLNIATFVAATATCANAVSIVEFTFNNTDIDESAGFAPSSINDNVASIPNNGDAFFAGTGGLTIQTQGTDIGMIQNAVAGYSGTTVTPGGVLPTPTSAALAENITGIAQFSLLSTPTPDGGAVAGYYVQPTSFNITGTGTNLSGIVLVDTNGQSSFVSTSTINGAFDLTFDLSTFDPIGYVYGQTERYSLFLVGSNSGASITATFALGDTATFSGDLISIPEPSTYLAGITIVGLGAFLFYRRRKQTVIKEEEAN